MPRLVFNILVTSLQNKHSQYMYIIILMTVYVKLVEIHVKYPCVSGESVHLNTCQLVANNIELKLNATDHFLMHEIVWHQYRP